MPANAGFAPADRAVHAHSVADLRAQARRRLPRAVFDFFDGGAEDERTLRANVDAFARTRLVPRVLVDVHQVETRVTIAGKPWPLPFAVAPMGAMGFGRHQADIAVARAAADFGIPFVLAMTATASIERVAKHAGGRLWFQVSPLTRRDVMLDLVRRASDAGCEALVLTVDLAVGGKRERDLRNDFAVPFRFTSRNVVDFARHPAWAIDMLRHGLPRLENLLALAPDAADTQSLASSIGRSFDASFDWRGVDEVRRLWPRTLMLKGVMHPRDAVRAAELGCDGVVVSNHGGRQLDGAIATLDALPAVRAAVDGRIAVLMDGGVRRGTHVIKAIARGAHAVLAGRAVLFGVCAGGEDGAHRALAILRDELIRAMQLCGTPTPADVTPDLAVADASGNATATDPPTLPGT